MLQERDFPSELLRKGRSHWDKPLSYRSISETDTPRNNELVAYADDVAVVIVAKHLDEINNMLDITFERIRRSMDTVSLQLAKHKTEAVLITSRKVIETIKLKVGEQKKSYQNRTFVYRLSAIRVASAIRTISEEAVYVIGGTISRDGNNSGMLQRRMLSGHSCVRAYFHRFKHDDSSECPPCPGVAG
ncbi:hypothetical protein EVAR_44481_1 [Eumeta japonica]|uniref:Reverse transcriptase domain-containing protein n=1 Tax=Eumeta variegata TaxID=151549 RepID=A0A4C1WJ77_EUMVA|nr:hypothetical protein EVAR_44481_1 [Eumeta japonica]